MPKTNDASGATYLGHEGIVEHAGGAGSTRPGGLSEVDVSRNLDGTAVDGYESEEREVEDREGAALAEPTLLPAPETEDAPETKEQPEQETKEREEATPSAGSNSAASRSNSAKQPAKNAASRR